jgi:hypothetical protein
MAGPVIHVQHDVQPAIVVEVAEGGSAARDGTLEHLPGGSGDIFELARAIAQQHGRLEVTDLRLG